MCFLGDSHKLLVDLDGMGGGGKIEIEVSWFESGGIFKVQDR